MEDPEDRATEDPVAAPAPELVEQCDSATEGPPSGLRAPTAAAIAPLDCYFCRGGAASHYDSQGRVRQGHGASSPFHPPRAAEKVLAPPLVAPEEAVRPEVVTPAVRGVTHAECPGCQKGETPHRSEYGYALNPGHKNPSKGEKAVKQAIVDLQSHAVKAVKTLARCLDDKNPWVALTAARAVVERTVPATKGEPADSGPALVLPAGTKIAIFATDADAPVTNVAGDKAETPMTDPSPTD